MRYKVYITRTFGDYFEVDADDEIEAINRAEDEFDKLTINGYEMLQYEQDLEEMEEL